MEYWEKYDRRFIKVFLLNEKVNKNKWLVPEESIPVYMKTFIGQPLVEEPGEEHFGAQYMETWEILKEQEKYRKGTILGVDYNPAKKEAIAVIEIYDDDLWDRILAGESINVSPAVAGFPEIQPDGSKLYRQWFGLHLARVRDPAYGIMHASIKQTCEGTERECVNQLINSAAAMNISFNPLAYTECELKLMETPAQQQKEKDEERRKMETKMSAFDTRLAAIEKSISSIAMSMGKPHEEEEEMETETAQYGNDKIGVHSGIPGKEKQKGAHSTASLQSKVAALEKQVAMYEEQDKSAMVDEIIGMMLKDEMAMEHERDGMHEEMMKEPKPMLAAKLKTAQAYHEKLAGKQTGLASTPNRIVSIASQTTADGPVTHDAIKEMLP